MASYLSNPVLPSDRDIALATESSRLLASIFPELKDETEIQVEESRNKLKLPTLAIHLLMDILENMSKGQPVSIIPTHAELTTQQAANILNVSRPFLVKLIEEGKLQFRKVGTHRRIRFDELMAYKRETNKSREQILAELSKIAQEEDMGY